jgi:two-component system sensor histidine kinase DesK
VADLPGSTEQVPADRRELAGWVVREAVTNVVRHSHAAACRIRLDTKGVEICDDGIGPTAAPTGGSGIAGLRERVEASGARLNVGRSDLGGFRVKVSW